MFPCCCGFWTDLMLGAIVVTVIHYLRQEEPTLVFGIYRQRCKNYYFKFTLMYALLSARKLVNCLKRKIRLFFDEEHEVNEYRSLETPQPLSTDDHAIDAVYFNGENRDHSTLVCGTARRKKNLVNGFLYLRVAEFSDKLLVSPRLPDSCMKQTEEELGSYTVEGIKLSPVVPMKYWKIEYDGNMRFENEHNEVFRVQIDAKWKSELPYSNFDTDMNPEAVARAMAKQYWSREYFENLKNFHQTHYEQFGDITGTATINGKEYTLDLSTVRDHSFGKQRDWKNFHRYVMHFITLENGNRITVGVICMPVTFTSLEAGFVTIKEENKNYSVSSVSLELYQHGEFTNPPTDYAFQFVAGGETYLVKVQAHDCPEFFLGEEAECRIVEQLCAFEVNGVKGWGAAEWQYRHVTGLPEK